MPQPTQTPCSGDSTPAVCEHLHLESQPNRDYSPPACVNPRQIIRQSGYTRPLTCTDALAVTTADTQQKPRPFLDLIISIVIPSVILMKLSGPDKLGATMALVIALAFPIGYGLYELIFHGKRNGMALLGVISVMLTGGIGLLKIDAQWLAVKEAAIPLCIGVGVLIANKLGYPLVRKLLFNPAIMNVDKIHEELEKKQNTQLFNTRLDNANTLLAGTFLFSAVMNYLLAKAIVTSESGSTAFNEELGRMTLLSYPVIAIPSMIMMLGIFWFIWRTVNRLTGLTLEEIMVTEDNKSEN